MKEILDRHAARLTPEERRAIWTAVSGGRTSRPQRPRWMVPTLATAAALAVAVSVLVVSQRPPARASRPAPSRPAGSIAKLEAPATVKAGGRAIAEERATAPARAGTRRPAPATVAARGVVPAAPSARALSAEAIAAAISPDSARARALAEAARRGLPAGTGVLAGRVTDAHGQAVPYANVLIPATRQGTQTDADGRYVVRGVPAGEVEVRIVGVGYGPVTQKITVKPDLVASADFAFGEQRVVKQLESIEVSAQKRIVDTKSSATKQTITADQVREIPVDRMKHITSVKAGIVPQGGEPHDRGGRKEETKVRIEGVTPGQPAQAPPVVPITGGTKLPNDEPYDAMYFKHYGVNPFIETREDALSTFAVDVDAASYTVARRYLGLGQLPPPEAVRVEEFVNFFAQGYPRFEDTDFRILVDGAPAPFRPGYQLVRIGIKGREIADRDRRPARLTFVIDVSGSMAREDRLELVKRALRLLVDQLRAGDRIGIVVYGTQGRVLLEPMALGAPADEDVAPPLPPVRGTGRERILEAIDALRPEGSTNAEEGLRLGYDMARRAYRQGAINRVVLCSDGVANVGLTGPQSILAAVRSAADRGIALTTIGFGMGNYNDVLMEQLADRGDGNHYYVDDLDEARRVFVENLTGTLQVIARDAKVQVEFDSTRVLRYRLLGFENRDVADRDFRNDQVDAGEIGAGHEVTALYEVKLAPGVARGALVTVRLRWARPEHEGAGAPRVRELAARFDAAALHPRFQDAAPRFRLDAAVAQLAEILRGSYWAKEARIADVLPVARAAAGVLHDDRADELVTLAEKAAVLHEQARKDGRR